MFKVTKLAPRFEGMKRQPRAFNFNVVMLKRNNVTVAQVEAQNRIEFIKDSLSRGKSYPEAIRSWDTKARKNENR
jgi:hypothetical protein